MKLEVLEKCVSTTIIYACETWGSHSGDVELCYRSGLRRALNVRQNLNNEIVYIETGKWPLCSQLKKAQLKFWLYVNDYILEYPTSALAKVVRIGRERNISYLAYYEELKRDYGDPVSCQKRIESMYYDIFMQKLQSEFEKDVDSRLGTYYRVNPLLLKYVPNPQPIMEIEREIITRYRTGSHSLAIEIGRYSNVSRENRKCVCGNYVQSVWHIFNECLLTREIVQQNYVNLQEVFADGDIHRKLILICNKLKIPC